MEPQPQAPPDDDALVGRTIDGKFRIEAMVGKGAMGCVYRATQLNLKKTVAIKVLNPARPTDGAFAARFKREAKAASRMDHPNSLRVIDFGQDEGLLYIAMEYLQGRDLLAVLRDDYPLSRERIVGILSQILAALAVAHEMGVIHRDLKPENIMLLPSKDDEGNPHEVVKVCDFGIAKIVEPDVEPVESGPELDRSVTHTGTLTAHGMLIGTPEYMSPEQARGEPADARSDLYSLGVILYQLLVGRLPFIAASKIRLVIKHVEERPVPPTEVDSKVDVGLEAICMKALEKRPDARFQAAREMRAALKAALEGDPGAVRAPLASSAPSNPTSPSPEPGSGPSGRSGRTAASEAAPASAPKSAGAGVRALPRMSEHAMPSTASAIDDPVESAAAILEARKLLSTASAPRSTGPAVTPSAAPARVATDGPRTPRPRPSRGVAVGVVLAVVVAVLLALGAYFASRP